MHELSLFQFLQTHIFKNLLQQTRQEGRFKVAVVSIFGTAFWASLFLLFYRGFLFLFQYVPADYSRLLLDYIFSIFFFSLFVMLTFSATIIAFSVLFYARETDYLMTCPFSMVGIFFYKVSETSLFASWAVFFLGLPVCFSYAISQRSELLFYPLLVVAFIPYILIPAIVGSVLAMIIALYLVPWRRVLAIGFLVLLTIALCWWGYKVARLEREIPVFSTAWLFNLLGYLDFARHPLMPCTWMARAMNALMQQDYEEYGFYLLLLTVTALFLSMLAYLLAEKTYTKAWSEIHSTTAKKRFWQLAWLAPLTRCFLFLGPQDRSFLEKDIKIFLRDPLQWGQFAILLGLLFLYILNLRTFKYDQQNIFWKHVIAVLNLTATGLTICTFASRFIFPLLSLEGKRFWTLGVMPIARQRILLAKFVFAVFTLLLTGEVLVLLSCGMLRLPWELTLLHALTMAAIVCGVAGLSVGLGAIYPNFREDSPAKIVSGFGGTLNLVLNLVFVLLMVAIQLVPSHLVLKHTLQYEAIYLSCGATLGLAAFSCGMPLYLGLQSFNRREI